VSGIREDVSRGVTVRDLRRELAALNWGKGLTRDQIRRKCRRLPEGIYLRLPAKKLYFGPTEVMHDARIAPSRAEGDFLGAAPDLPEEESLDEGGPPAWGPSPLFTPGGTVDGNSAEDRDQGDLGE
jgi:hypothetical protein